MNFLVVSVAFKSDSGPEEQRIVDVVWLFFYVEGEESPLKSNRPENLIYLADILEENVMKNRAIRHMDKYDTMDVQSTSLLQESHFCGILLGFPELTVGEWNKGTLTVFRN